MAYLITYRLSFKNDEGQDMIIHISDTDSAVGTPVFTDLTITTCSLEVANSGDDPFSIVRPTTLSFSFVPTTTHGLSTFKSGVDRRFLVEAFADTTSTPIFKGYLLTDETKQSLLPVSVNGSWATHTVEMTAICNLSTLKEFPLLDAGTGLNPRGWFKPIEYLSWILKATGHELPINIVDSIVYAIDPVTDGNWYNTTYLWSKSFEADVNVSVDCYEALEQILKGRFVFQYGGEWWIVRVDEMIGGAYNIFRYDADGAFISLDTDTFEKQLGKTQPYKFLNKDAFVFPIRPHKYDLLEYRYELPKEIVDNYDFVRGAQLSYNPVTKIGTYTLDDWTTVKHLTSGGPDITPYIYRLFEDTNATYERERWVVIPPHANWHLIRSNPIYVMKDDKVVFSFDRKVTSDHSAGGTNTEFTGQLRLYGDDGTFWTCNGNPNNGAVGRWVACASTFTNNQQYITMLYSANQMDERLWQSSSIESFPLPVGGILYCCILQSSLFGSTEETHVGNVNFDYIPFINGDYSKYSGQHHKVYQSGEYKSNLEQEVNTSDSPKRLFKGALHYEDSPGEYKLTEFGFWDYRSLPSPVLDKFGKFQAFDYFNHSFDFVNKIQSSFTGMDSLANPSNMPGMLHQYTVDFSTNDDHTADRIFQLISFKQDLITNNWEGVLVPTNNSTMGHPTSWDHEFKYRPL